MTLQINTFDDLLYIIDTHPEWRRRLVKALFPEIDLPKALQELVEANRLVRAQLGDVEGHLARMEDRQTRMEEQQAQMNGRLDRIEDRQTHMDGQLTRIDTRLINVERSVATLKGDSYENSIGKKADAVFGYGLRRGRDSRQEVSIQLDSAEQSGKITTDEYIQVLAADLLWSGRLKQADENVILVVETSWFAEQSDIDRAIARAAILQRIGMHAFPVVTAREWTANMRQAAEAYKVIIVDEFSLDKQSWEVVLAASIGLGAPSAARGEG